MSHYLQALAAIVLCGVFGCRPEGDSGTAKSAPLTINQVGSEDRSVGVAHTPPDERMIQVVARGLASSFNANGLHEEDAVEATRAAWDELIKRGLAPHRSQWTALSGPEQDRLRQAVEQQVNTMGKLVIETTPGGAKCTVSQEDWGTTAKARWIQQGVHDVVLVLPGYEPEQLQAQVPARRKVELKVRLREIGTPPHTRPTR